MKTRQKIANEIRDLITQVNARVAELEEEGYRTHFEGGMGVILNKITKVDVTKVIYL